MCTVLLPPGGNPIAVNKTYHIKISYLFFAKNPITLTQQNNSNLRRDSLVPAISQEQRKALPALFLLLIQSRQPSEQAVHIT
jgi:hypothetical protein